MSQGDETGSSMVWGGGVRGMNKKFRITEAAG